MISRKLVTVEGAAATPQLFVVEGNPTDGYELFAVELMHLGHYRRSWQAHQAARVSSTSPDQAEGAS